MNGRKLQVASVAGSWFLPMRSACSRARTAMHGSSSLIWGRNHNTASKRNLNSYLLESLYPVASKNFLTGRVELVDKDELFADNHSLEYELEHGAGSTRIQAYTLGYTRDVGTFKSIQSGIGVNFTSYAIPSAIKPYYGDHSIMKVRLSEGVQ